MTLAALTDEALLKFCRQSHSRASGPGGQHRNKVQTAVTLTHAPTGRSASASERRSQSENLRVALRRLRVELALHERAAWSEPSALWRSRCRDRRIVLNPEHRDYPAMLAEALDVLDLCKLDPRKAGDCLDITPTQLIRLLADEPRALTHFNSLRRARNLKPLAA